MTTLKEGTLECVAQLGLADAFDGWDGEFLGIYLPDVGGGPDVGEIVRRMAERREQKDHYVLDLGHERRPLTHSQAKQLIAKLDEARIPYERRSKHDTEATWAEHQVKAVAFGHTLQRERIFGGYRVLAVPNLPSIRPRVIAVDGSGPELSVEGESIADAVQKILKLLRSRQS